MENKPTVVIDEEAKNVFKSLMRRARYSAAFMGLVSHSCISQSLFTRSGVNEEAIRQFMSADLLGLACGFVLCAAFIETIMLITEKRLG